MTERERGVLLRRLDIARLEAKVRAEATESGELQDVERFTVSAGYGYAIAEHNGTLYALCSEGVGWPVSDDAPLHVDLYLHEPDTMHLLPRWAVLLSPDEVRALATDEQVDLADFVRRFGARLESNFYLWHRELSK